MQPLLVAGGLFGFLSVAIGAWAEHALRARLDEEAHRVLMVALRYHQLHSVVILIIGLCLLFMPDTSMAPTLRWVGWLMVSGVVLFSGSIYGFAFTGMRHLTFLSPFGGLAFMAGWLLLAWLGLSGIKD